MEDNEWLEYLAEKKKRLSPMEDSGKKSKEEGEWLEYLEHVHAHVQRTYPGLKRFIHLKREIETGITTILVFDVDLEETDPVHVININPRDLLICIDGFVVPIMNYAENQTMRKYEILPDGFIVADY